eukprot:COSAG02_NODE_79_length_40228_cov_18.435762_35_plen_85_part_00
MINSLQTTSSELGYLLSIWYRTMNPTTVRSFVVWQAGRSMHDDRRLLVLASVAGRVLGAELCEKWTKLHHFRLPIGSQGLPLRL